MKYIVRSTVVIETLVEADDYDDAVDQAGRQIDDLLAGQEFDYADEAVVYDQDGNELEAAE